MREYGKVQSSFWEDESVRGLSDGAKLLFVYLLTCSHTNQLGCFRLPDGYAAEDLGWPPATVSERFAELFQNGFATRDEGSKWVLIFDFLRFNKIENPNQGKAAAKLFEQIGDANPLKPCLSKEIRRHAPAFPVDVLDRFETLAEGFPKPFRNQEQKQEHQQEEEQDPKQEPSEVSPLRTGAQAAPALTIREQADLLLDQPDEITQPKKARAKPKRTLPADFPGPAELERARWVWAQAGVTHLSAEHEAQQFRNHHTSKATQSASWPASWSTWINNAPSFSRGAPDSRNPPGRQGAPRWSALAQAVEGFDYGDDR